MRGFLRAGLLAIAVALGSTGAAPAASLHVTPVTIDLTAPAGAGLLTLRNEASAPVTVQLRVFKWVQENGEDKYIPTRDVVASPPMTKLGPGVRQTVRVVRVSKASIEQVSYRLFIDEIPQASRAKASGVRFLIRQSIPVFFSAPGIERAKVSWSLSAKDGKLALTGRNSGSDRQKVSSLLLKDGNGKVLAQVRGLAGYVLGKSSRRWEFDLPASVRVRGNPVTLTAEGDKGPLRAKVTISSGG